MTQNKLAEVSSAGTALFILEILQAQQYFVRDRMQSKFFFIHASSEYIFTKGHFACNLSAFDIRWPWNLGFLTLGLSQLLSACKFN